MDTFFSDYKIIDDGSANVFCDQIMSNIRQYFMAQEQPLNDLVNRFVLSGRLSSNLQDNEEIPIKNVVFVTDSREVFDYHQKNAKAISPSNTGVISFKNHTLVYHNNLFIEVWFFPEELIVEKYELMPLQKNTQIPIETL